MPVSLKILDIKQDEGVIAHNFTKMSYNTSIVTLAKSNIA